MNFTNTAFCKKHVYPIGLCCLFAAAGLSFLCAVLGISPTLLWICILLPFLSIPIHLLYINKKAYLFFLLSPIFLALVMFLLIRAIGSVELVMDAYTEWWEVDRAVGLPPYVFLVLIPIFPTISIIYLLQQTYIGRFLSVLIEWTSLLVFYFWSYPIGKSTVVLCVAYLLFFLFESAFYLYGKLKKRRDNTKTVASVVHLWPLVALMSLLLAVLPYRGEPIRWTLVKNIWDQITVSVVDLVSMVQLDLFDVSSDFGLSFSGYSDSADLVSKLFPQSKEALYVKSHRFLSDTIYIRGNSKNIFTGTSWESDITLPDELLPYDESMLDAAEFSYAILRTGQYKQHINLYQSNRYEFHVLQSQGTTIFSPLKTTKVETIYPLNFEYSSEIDGFRSKKRLKRDTVYRCQFNQMNLGSGEFAELVSLAPYSYDDSFSKDAPDYDAFSKDFSVLTKSGQLDTVLKLRRNHIYENYLALPETMPSRVKELAISLTEGITGDYEKMLVLENYLQQFIYTTSPTPAPHGRDTIDFFLFDSHEGFCTYYASALAILGRSVGIPTRYVQGYFSNTPSSRSEWTLTGENAHAWTECYLEGLGWVTLDATPSYHISLYQPWHIEEKDSDLSEVTPSVLPPYFSSDLISPTLSPTPDAGKGLAANLRFSALVFAISFAFILTSMLAYVLYKQLSLSRFRRTASVEQRFLYETREIFRLVLQLCRVEKWTPPDPNPTLLSFTEQFAILFPSLADRAFQFCHLYSCVRYGSHPITEEGYEELISYKNELLQELATRKNRYVLILYRISELLRY